eukprot:7361272-Prymnesium_polylepis.1
MEKAQVQMAAADAVCIGRGGEGRRGWVNYGREAACWASHTLAVRREGTTAPANVLPSGGDLCDCARGETAHLHGGESKGRITLNGCDRTPWHACGYGTTHRVTSRLRGASVTGDIVRLSRSSLSVANIGRERLPVPPVCVSCSASTQMPPKFAKTVSPRDKSTPHPIRDRLIVDVVTGAAPAASTTHKRRALDQRPPPATSLFVLPVPLTAPPMGSCCEYRVAILVSTGCKLKTCTKR